MVTSAAAAALLSWARQRRPLPANGMGSYRTVPVAQGTAPDRNSASSGTQSTAIPAFDVEGLCRHQASLSDPSHSDPSVRLNCLRQQQSDYDFLKTRWPGYMPAICGKCAAIAKSQNASGGFGDYDVLVECITVETQKADDTAAASKFRFKP
jgi:hypothetical protein